MCDHDPGDSQLQGLAALLALWCYHLPGQSGGMGPVYWTWLAPAMSRRHNWIGRGGRHCRFWCRRPPSGTALVPAERVPVVPAVAWYLTWSSCATGLWGTSTLHASVLAASKCGGVAVLPSRNQGFGAGLRLDHCADIGASGVLLSQQGEEEKSLRAVPVKSQYSVRVLRTSVA